MKVTPEDLPRRLDDGLPSAILLYGEEPLLIDESLRRVRDAARERGFADRIPLAVETGFDWGRLLGASQTLSLFAERRLVELRLPSGRPGEAGTRALVEYAEAADPDVCLVVITGRLDARSKQAKWVKTLDTAGWVLEHRSMDRDGFQTWFRGRLRERGLTLDQDTLADLCHFLEGNLLAAVQEIDRIALFADDSGRVSPEAVRDGLADHARFTVYAAVDAGLEGAAPQALRILQVLKREGIEPAILSWAFARELRTLAHIQHGLRAGGQARQLMRGQRVWSGRERLVKAALARLDTPRIEGLLRQMARCDRVLKGREDGDIWREFDTVALMMCDAQHAVETARATHAAS